MSVEKKLRHWSIYKITNPKGRVYIGKTRDFNERMGKYMRLECKHQRLMYASICKYGWEAHIKEEIEKMHSTEYFAFEREKFWIDFYKSNKNRWPNENGMNLTDGGDGGSGIKFTEEARIRRSEASKKVWANPASRNKLSASQLKRWNDPKEKAKMREVFANPVVKLKQSIAAKNRHDKIGIVNNLKKGGESVRKPIIQFDSNGIFIKEFPSTLAAASELGIHPNNIHYILKGKNKTSHGFIFKYK